MFLFLLTDEFLQMKAWVSYHFVREGRKEEMCNYLYPDLPSKFSPASQQLCFPIRGLPNPCPCIFSHSGTT